MQKPGKPIRAPRWLLWLSWLVLLALLVGMAFLPVSMRLTRLAFLLLLASVVVGFVALVWKQKIVRTVALVILAAAICLGVMPGRAHDAKALRAEYIRSLRRYEGAPFVWGGESFTGVDCSGLIRRGMIDACLIEGGRTLNPRLVRQGAFVWWHDCSAGDIANQYLGLTQVRFSISSINALDHARIQPGDLAVTKSGSHILACVGDQMWIEADPGPMRVIQVQVPAKNGWFNGPMNIVRWKLLDDSGS